ncbi:MAG: hypothetical protein A3G24_20945 [Betaproteobacteria bacterium RIFCSPLOWO2_12_FULL_62_13]|nr:MAG: hypothetical protein A3G24_20945 [Betaproteobacteria bacterium RIFCSPLOWO2_12_FULL_62_13]
MGLGTHGIFHVSSFSQHEQACEWLDARVNAVTPVALPWPSLLALLRATASPRVFERPALARRSNQMQS